LNKRIKQLFLSFTAGAVLAFGIPSPALAGQSIQVVTGKALQAVMGDYIVTLTSENCTSAKVIELIGPEVAATLKAGTVSWGKNLVPLCWKPDASGTMILVIDETGDSGGVPIGQFRVIDEI
jgi:hypothetical protein